MFLPADKATAAKCSGFARTMSRVWVPIEPVDPRIARFFLNVAPSRLFFNVSWRAASLSTGADGGIHRSRGTALFEETYLVDLIDEGVKAFTADISTNMLITLRKMYMIRLWVRLKPVRVVDRNFLKKK